MSDLFHKNVPFKFIEQVFDVMSTASHHRFQILTKRSERLLELSPKLTWPDNVWMGVTVESADYLSRLDDLRQTDAAIKFVSLEPLLGPIPQIDFEDIDWVIAGGESGPGARPMHPNWPTDIRDQCINAQVPFFFKQWGGTNRKKTGRILENRIWDDMPIDEPIVLRRETAIGQCV